MKKIIFLLLFLRVCWGGVELNVGGTDSNYIDMGDNSAFTFGGASDRAFSITAWIYVHDATNFNIVSKFQNSTKREYTLSTFADDKMAFVLYDVSQSAAQGRSNNAALSENVWTHLVATYDGRGGASAKDGCKIYKNGARIDDTDVVGGANYAAMENLTATLMIGALNDSSSATDGIIGEVRLYDRLLSADEALTLYYSSGSDGNHTPGDSIVEIWRMDENTDGVASSGASSIRGLSGNGYDGTPTSNTATQATYRATPLKTKKRR